MPADYEVIWQPSGKVEEYVGSRGNYYEFSPTERLHLHTTLIWCHRCGKITEGEDLSTVEQIDKDIYDLLDPNSNSYQMTRYGLLNEITGKGEDYLAKRIDELRRRKRWREARVSPPKCIYCASTQILSLPTGETIPSPQGFGTLEVKIAGMCSTLFNEWFFTPEGDRIPRETVPKYWGIVG